MKHLSRVFVFVTTNGGSKEKYFKYNLQQKTLREKEVLKHQIINIPVETDLPLYYFKKKNCTLNIF